MKSRHEAKNKERASDTPSGPMFPIQLSQIWRYTAAESFAFQMICLYFLFEYVRPQSIIEGMDVIPWMQIFLCLSLVGLFFDKYRLPARLGAATFWMIAFLVVILISSYLAYRPDYSFQRLDSFYIWLIVFLLSALTLTGEKRLFVIVVIFLLASSKLSFFGARTWALRGFSFTSWGLRGPPGYFTNSGELAAQMVVFFGISYHLYMHIRRFSVKWLSRFVLLMPITAAMTVLASSSRGAQLALAVQLYLAFLHKKISLKAILAVAVVSYLAFLLVPDEQIARFNDMGNDTTSLQRLLYWQNGWEMLKQHPWFGVGYFNFPYYFATHYPQDLLVSSAELAHNIFIQVGADLGFVGLVVYAILVYYGLRLPIRARKKLVAAGRQDDWRVPLSKGLNLGFIGFILAGQFVSIVYYPFMWIHLALSCALFSSVCSSLTNSSSEPPGIDAANDRREKRVQTVISPRN